MWKLVAEAAALGVALVTTWLDSKGVQITPQQLAEKAQKYIDLNQKDLNTEESRDDDRWD